VIFVVFKQPDPDMTRKGVSEINRIILRFNLVLVIFFLILTGSISMEASDTGFEELVSRYIRAERWEKSSIELRKDLLSKAEPKEPVDLWWSLWDMDSRGEQRAANALKLVEYLYPGGDISRWDEIQGLWYPSLIPTTLAAIDAVYVAAWELLEMDREDASWLARDLVNDLGRSSRAKHYFMKHGPEEYRQIITGFSERGLEPDYGNWTEPETIGSLSLASPVRGSISQNFAVSFNLVFLNASGEIVNLGTYAWDREKGKIYEVIDRERDDNNVVFLPFGR